MQEMSEELEAKVKRYLRGEGANLEVRRSPCYLSASNSTV